MTWAGVSAPLTANIIDTTPETIGAAKLVPAELLMTKLPAVVVPELLSVRISDEPPGVEQVGCCRS